MTLIIAAAEAVSISAATPAGTLPEWLERRFETYDAGLDGWNDMIDPLNRSAPEANLSATPEISLRLTSIFSAAVSKQQAKYGEI